MYGILARIIPAAALSASVLLFFSMPEPINGDWLWREVEQCNANLNPPIPRLPWCCGCIQDTIGTICWEVRHEGEYKQECQQGNPGLCPDEWECGIN